MNVRDKCKNTRSALSVAGKYVKQAFLPAKAAILFAISAGRLGLRPAQKVYPKRREAAYSSVEVAHPQSVRPLGVT